MFERGETLHRGKLFVAFTYQNFQFSNMDGINLKSIPAYFPAPNTNGGIATVETSTRVDLKINQFAIYADYGLTNRLDISVAVPFLDVKLARKYGVREYLFCWNGLPRPALSAAKQRTKLASNSRTGSSTGIGDVVFRAKGSLWQGEHIQVAAAVDFQGSIGRRKKTSWERGRGE